MKKGLVVLLLLLIVPLASAVEVKLSKEVYEPGETLQAEIYGNFLEPLKVEKVHFYRERNLPLEYDVLKLSDKYLLYAILPYKEGNYTLTIEDVKYEYENSVSDAPVVSEFKINDSGGFYLKINPGFVVAREDFYIGVESEESKEVVAGFLGDSKTIDLVAGREEKVYFSVSNVTSYTEANVSLGDYSVPVFVFPNKSDAVESPKFRFNPLELSAAIIKGQKHTFTIALINFGLENISDVELTSSSELSIELSPSSISSIGSKSIRYVNLTVSSGEEGSFDGSISATSSNLTTTIPISIYVTENQSEIILGNNTSPGYVDEGGCEESGGHICGNDEECDGVLVPKTDGLCCLGVCVEESSDSDYSWVYGLILIVALIGGLVGFSYYMKKKQNKKQDPLKKREESFNQRISAPPSTEVKGGLSKS